MHIKKELDTTGISRAELTTGLYKLSSKTSR
jgi:hypothetical protein